MPLCDVSNKNRGIKGFYSIVMVLIYSFKRLQLGYWSIFPTHFLHVKLLLKKVAEALNQTSQKNQMFQCDFSFYWMSLYYLFSSRELFTLQYWLYTNQVLFSILNWCLFFRFSVSTLILVSVTLCLRFSNWISFCHFYYFVKYFYLALF